MFILETYKDRFAEAVKDIMEEKDLSAEAIGGILGIKKNAVYKILDGTNKPTPEHMIKICDYGHFSANWMLLGMGDPKTIKEPTLKSLETDVKYIRKVLMEKLKSVKI